jgi:uncharacterized protein (DUF697 family)
MTPDEKADAAITTMIAAVVGTSVIPAYVNWAVTATAMGTGVVAIGLSYGVELTKDEAWHLVKQFIGAAGFWFMGMVIGSRILSMILTSTGIGYFGAVALDATVSGALAYAIGEASKAYFKGVRDKKVLGDRVRNAFKAQKAKLDQQKVEQSA